MLKKYHSVEDVLRSPWTLFSTQNTVQNGLTDRVLHSTRLDDEVYKDLHDKDDLMDEIEREATQKLRTFPALSRDVFQSFYSISPHKNDECQLSAAAKKFNVRILSHVMEQNDFATLKTICEGREFLAYEAASEFIGRTAKELDDLLAETGGEKGALNTLEGLIKSRDKAAANLSDLLEQQKRSSAPDSLLAHALVSAANLVENKQQQVEAVSKMVDTSLIRHADQTDAVLSSAISAAKEKAEEVHNIISAWSDEPGEVKRSPINIELLDRVRQSSILRNISKYLGRFREIFAHGKRNEYAYGRGETYSLEFGNDLSCIITSDLAMLASPITTPLFVRKYRDKHLKQYRRRERVNKGFGDIICCLDESESTKGDAAAWGKAVAMTLLEIAADRGRKFALIHFSSSENFRTDLFLPGNYTTEDKLQAAETYLGGGTNFETPLSEAIRLMEHEGFESADIVFVTDGDCILSKSFCEQLISLQAAQHFTITGILLDAGINAIDFSLKEFCQKLYRTSELDGEEIVQALVCDRI